MQADREIELIESIHHSRLTKRTSLGSQTPSAYSRQSRMLKSSNSIKEINQNNVTSRKPRDSSYEESLLLSNLNFDNDNPKRAKSPERQKLTKISSSILNQSRQSGIE